jgi:hypothetical protein
LVVRILFLAIFVCVVIGASNAVAVAGFVILGDEVPELSDLSASRALTAGSDEWPCQTEEGHGNQA